MNDPQQLKYILSELVEINPKDDISISGLSLDSRKVKQGDLYIAYQGESHDSRAFINEAIKNGAVAVVAEPGQYPGSTSHKSSDVPIIYIENIKDEICNIGAKFYNFPSEQLLVIGVTGTNGKTSCSHLIAQSIYQDNYPCAVIGTIGNGMVNQIKPTALTTPDAITIQGLLADYLKQGAKTVVVETSSHALEQQRVKNVAYDIGIFTNLSHDHLDYHGDMQRYAAAKSKLFNEYNLAHAIINIDDVWGQKILAKLPANTNAISYGIHNKKADIVATDIIADHKGIRANVKTPWANGQLRSNLIGQFNVLNLLAVLACLKLTGLSLEESLTQISKLHGIQGRMETIHSDNKATAVVDFAHTPDALEKVLQSLKALTKGKIWCVFGCGGDRDKAKRPLMGKIAEQYADELIVTNDNPRHEEPQEIVKQILSGISDKTHTKVIYDRKAAIHFAIRQAEKGDIVLIAGKGHEKVQIIGEKTVPFDDVQVVRSFL